MSVPPPPAPLFLMCPPDHFAITHDCNKFAHDKGMKAWLADPEGVRRRAREQWDALKATLEGLGAKTLVLPADPDLPDQIYTADATQSYVALEPGGGYKRSTILSEFVNDYRAGEVQAQRGFLESVLDNTEFIPADGTLEGTGDNVYDPFRDLIWSGHGLRSSPRSHESLAEAAGVEVVNLLVKSPFFHIDTALAPLPNGHLLCYPGGLQPEAFDKLRERALADFGLSEKDYLVEVDEAEALAFACNVVCLGADIVMPRCGERVPALLEAKGYRVHPVEVEATLLAGGGPHCLTNNLNLTRVPGGLAGRRES